MATIGDQTVLTLSGVPDLIGEGVETITRAGAVQNEFRKTGKHSTETTHETQTVVADITAARALATTYKKMQSTVVTVTDDAGASWPGLMILRVEVGQIRAVSGYVSGAVSYDTGFLVTARWSFQHAGVAE